MLLTMVLQISLVTLVTLVNNTALTPRAFVAACGGRVWYLWVNDLAPRDTYLPIGMMFSTGQTIPTYPDAANITPTLVHTTL